MGKRNKRGFREKRDLTIKEDTGQEYAQVIKMFGGSRLEALGMDGVKRQCKIRGNMIRNKREWIHAGDIILLGLRDYQDEKADVILKYTATEARLLQRQGHLPATIKLNQKIDEESENINDDDEDNIRFTDDSEDKKDEKEDITAQPMRDFGLDLANEPDYDLNDL